MRGVRGVSRETITDSTGGGPLNYDAIKIWIDVAQFLITGGIGVYIYLVNRGEAIDKRISKFKEEANKSLTDHENRIGQVEAVMKFLPTHNDMTSVKSQLAGLQAETEGQTALLERLTKQVDRINEWLIDRAK